MSDRVLTSNGRNERDTSYVSNWTRDDPTRMYLEPDEDRVVGCLETRIANMSGYSIYHQEAIQIVRNTGKGGGESPEDNLWPEWQPFDTTPSKRAARMLIALDTGSSVGWDIEFPSLRKAFSIRKNDARKSYSETP